MATSRWVSAGLLVLAIAFGVSAALQWQTGLVLRQEIALRRDDNQVLARLRAENQRLRSAQVSAEEMNRLEADRAALIRLRLEMESLRARTEERGRNAATPVEPGPNPPALILKLAAGADGGLTIDGRPVDWAALRQRLGALPAGSGPVALRLRGPDFAGRTAEFNQVVEGVKGLVRELGLKLTLAIDRP